MKIGAPKEVQEGETRVAITPESAGHLKKLGHDPMVEAGAGAGSNFTDDAYRDAGVEVVDRDALWSQADVVAKVNKPTDDEVERLREGQTLVAFFGPSDDNPQMERAKERGATVVAMEMVPRISRAQKMDALSSMANIAGYRATIEAANQFGRFLTGQVTAAGKVPPAKVLVVGAGVAGLAAIGTATSLGARVYAFDVRPEVSEQIESMGAEFVFLDFEDSDGGDGSESGGYAKPSSPEFREAQLAKFRELAPDMDIVITTALIPGRAAPVLWTEDMVRAQKPGSVVVDLAAANGGNCELTKRDQIVEAHGVRIVGYTDYASRMGAQASTLYANNVRHMIADLTPEKDGVIQHDMDDDVIRGATVVHKGEITWPPPPPKVRAIAAQPKKPKAKEPTPEERRAAEIAAFQGETKRQVGLLAVAGLAVLIVGLFAPASFMQHFIVFTLACFVGFQVIWGVSHSLHTPLMAVTNAISSIIILGALMQFGSGSVLVVILAALSIFMAAINIFGGFLVTRRMLAMFQKS